MISMYSMPLNCTHTQMVAMVIVNYTNCCVIIGHSVRCTLTSCPLLPPRSLPSVPPSPTQDHFASIEKRLRDVCLFHSKRKTDDCNAVSPLGSRRWMLLLLLYKQEKLGSHNALEVSGLPITRSQALRTSCPL